MSAADRVRGYLDAQAAMGSTDSFIRGIRREGSHHRLYAADLDALLNALGEMTKQADEWQEHAESVWRTDRAAGEAYKACAERLRAIAGGAA